MVDAKQLVVELQEFHFSLTVANLGYRAGVIEQAIGLIERLTPKPMTLSRAIELLNDIKFNNEDDWMEDRRFRTPYVISQWLGTGFPAWAAIAIAQAHEAGKDIVND